MRFPAAEPHASIAALLLVAGATVYALANTDFYWNWPELYYAKHAVVLVAAACGLVWRSTFMGARRSLMLLAACYLLLLLVATHDGTAALQGAAFFLACSVYATAVQRPHPLLWTVLLTVLIGVPLARNVYYFGGEHLLNTYYGRERLMLGYFHPKEAANAIVVCVLGFYMGLQRQHLLRWLMLACFGVLLYFAQSRNAMLFLAVFLFANWVYGRLGLNAVTAFSVVALAGVMAVLLTFDFDAYNELSSRRLSLWLHALEFPEDFEWRRTSFDAVRVDNYYIETYLQGGPIGLFAAFGLLFFVSVGSHSRAVHGIHALPLLFALGVNAMFDSGLTSTGNILQLMTWSIIIAAWAAPSTHAPPDAVGTGAPLRSDMFAAPGSRPVPRP